MKFKTLTVVGLGYVGLPTSVLFAQAGVKTLGFDVNEELVGKLLSGAFDSTEPGIKDLLEKTVEIGTLRFSTAIESSDAYIIAVPTPVNELRSPNMDYVMNATREIAKVLKPGQLVILESTSPPGSTERIAELISQLRPDLSVSGDDKISVQIAYCPERVLPGNAIFEIVHNDRIVGGLSKNATMAAKGLYGIVSRGLIHTSSAREAEISKLAENAFRDVNIAFANELAKLAASHKVNSAKVIELANRHPRVNILQPGVGVGGHCIPVDPWFLIDSNSMTDTLMETARRINDQQPIALAKGVSKLFLESKFERLLCLGLTYKPDSDDLRESPSLQFVREILKDIPNEKIRLVDPMVKKLMDGELNNYFQEFSYDISFSSSDLVVVLVSHSLFKNLDFGDAKVIRIAGTGQLL